MGDVLHFSNRHKEGMQRPMGKSEWLDRGQHLLQEGNDADAIIAGTREMPCHQACCWSREPCLWQALQLQGWTHLPRIQPQVLEEWNSWQLQERMQKRPALQPC